MRGQYQIASGRPAQHLVLSLWGLALLFASLAPQSASAQCAAPLAAGACSGTAVANGNSFSNARYFSGTGTFASGLRLNAGAVLQVCGAGTSLTLNRLTMNGGSIVVHAGATLIINANNNPSPALDFDDGSRLTNYGTVTFNYQVRLLGNASIYNAAGAIFNIQNNSKYLDLSAGDTRFANYGTANIGTLINFAGIVCNGNNSILNVDVLQNGKDNGYEYTGTGGSLGQTCIRVASQAYLFTNAAFSDDAQVKVCLAAGATVDADGSSNWGNAPVSNNCSSCIATLALPVEYAYFRAVPQAAAVQLEWATTQEKNAAYFQVERSADGRTFAPLHRVPAAGTTSHITPYRVEDTEPLPGQTSYYRLVQVDLDGTQAISKVIRANTGLLGAAKLNVQPNPSSGRVWVALPGGAQQAAVRVSTPLGQVVYQAAHPAGGAELDLSGLPKGMYVLHVAAGTQRQGVLLVLE